MAYSKFIQEHIDALQLSPQQVAASLSYLKALEKQFLVADFKLRRTLMDKQITSNVLNSTIANLEKNQADLEASNTELLRQKAEIEEKNQILEEQKKIILEKSGHKDRFLANVSHELRTPLNGILGIGYLLGNLLQDEKQTNYLNIIVNSAKNLLTIVNDLLDISRLETHTLSINARPFALNALLNELYSTTQLQSNAKNLQLHFKTLPTLPNYLIGDKVRLYQILINLLSNAVKFTNKGSITLTVAEQQTNELVCWLKFSVADTGIGIETTEIAHIFEDFKQISSNKDQQGLGLGLSIVKQLVSLMQGSITVDSQPNKGSCFSVLMPFAIATNEDIAQEQALQQQTQISHRWETKQVLLIEDNPVNRLYAENLLSKWNLLCTNAQTIKEAKQKVETQKYDCIFVDIGLPDGNGFEFIEWLQQNTNNSNCKTPIIILSAAFFEEYQQMATNLQVKAYLTKPFSPQQLFNEINNLFGSTANLSATLWQNMLPTTNTIAEQTNNDYLAHLRKLLKGNKKNMHDMVLIAIEQINEFVDQTTQNLLNNNWDKVFYDSHRLKSTLTTLGIENLKTQIQAIENLSYSRKNLEQIPALFEQFKQNCQTEIPKLQTELEKL